MANMSHDKNNIIVGCDTKIRRRIFLFKFIIMYSTGCSEVTFHIYIPNKAEKIKW